MSVGCIAQVFQASRVRSPSSVFRSLPETVKSTKPGAHPEAVDQRSRRQVTKRIAGRGTCGQQDDRPCQICLAVQAESRWMSVPAEAS